MKLTLNIQKKKILSRLNSYLGYNAVEKLKFVSFEGNDGVFKEKVLDNATNNKYKNEISKIKNEKVKKSLEELSKYFNKK